MVNRYQRVLPCVLFLLFVGAASAADAQRFFGTVVHADNTTPASGAIVSATDSAGVSAGRELTSARGDFVLPVSHPGRYTVTVLGIGNLPEIVRDVVVEPGRDHRIRIVITRDAPRPRPCRSEAVSSVTYLSIHRAWRMHGSRSLWP